MFLKSTNFALYLILFIRVFNFLNQSYEFYKIFFKKIDIYI